MKTEDLQIYCLDLMQAARHWRRLADAVVRPHGLSEATALAPAAHRAARRNETKRARRGDGRRRAFAGRSLDHLCAAGLVTRDTDPIDRRANCLNLTQRGMALASRVAKDLDARRIDAFALVDRDDIKASLRVFRQLTATADEPEKLAEGVGP